MMLKNIECDHYHGWGVGVVCGDNWVATPFVLNFGVDHMYSDCVYACKVEDGKYTLLNIFQDEPVKRSKAKSLQYNLDRWSDEFAQKFFREKVLFQANPRNYRYSFGMGDISPIVRFDTSLFNHIHIMFYKGRKGQRKLRVAASFIGNTSDDVIYGRHNMILLYDLPYVSSEIYGDALITLCADHFKHTANMYRHDCMIRMMCHPGKFRGGQYDSVLRFDSGRSEDTGRYDKFSTVKAITLNDGLAQSIMNIIPGLTFDES